MSFISSGNKGGRFFPGENQKGKHKKQREKEGG